jgi:type IV secretion system protein VirB5
MQYKKIVICLSMIWATSSAIAAGIPTFDATNLVQAVETVKNLKEQIKNQVAQIEKLEAQHKALTGSRNVGSILNNPALKDNIPSEWKDVYDKVKKGQIPGTNFAQLKQESGLVSNDPEKQKQYDVVLSNKALNMAALKKTEERLDNIEKLMKRVDTSADSKEAQDLIARVSAEQAIIQNDQMKLNLMMKLQEAEEKIAQEQKKKAFKEKYF